MLTRFFLVLNLWEAYSGKWYDIYAKNCYSSSRNGIKWATSISTALSNIYPSVVPHTVLNYTKNKNLIPIQTYTYSETISTHINSPPHSWMIKISTNSVVKN